nr:protein disulfide isomerase pTAC5, chloroplastic [Tanacetum cinerariifolium]
SPNRTPLLSVYQKTLDEVALLKQGFYCGEEDEEFSCFSSGTEWQSSIGVPEIGVMTVELLERLYNAMEMVSQT